MTCTCLTNQSLVALFILLILNDSRWTEMGDGVREFQESTIEVDLVVTDV